MQSAQSLFAKIHKSEWPAIIILEGNDAYLRREFRDALKREGFDLHYKDLKKKGPQPHDEDLSYSTSLFASSSFVWLESQARPDRWAADSKKIWERMCERADGQGLILCLQLPVPTKSKKNKVAAANEEVFRFEVSPAEYPAWIKRMDKKHDANLSPEKLVFLQNFNEELITLDGWIELWSLGGDVWSKIVLGWGDGKGSMASPSDNISSNPAYAWVDAVLSGDARVASLRLHELMKDSNDPLPLLGLISKTLKIWAALESGVTPSGEPPFLIDKIKKALNRRNSNRKIGEQSGCKLIKAASKIDVLLKSKPIDSQAALLQLTALSFKN